MSWTPPPCRTGTASGSSTADSSRTPRAGIPHTVDCSTIGGILDPADPGDCGHCATGREPAATVEQYFTGVPGSLYPSGVRRSNASTPASVPHEINPGSWRDGNGDEIMTADRYGRAAGDPNRDPNADDGVAGNVVITRRLDPEALGAYIYIDFGPWQWQYGAAATPDDRAYKPPRRHIADRPRLGPVRRLHRKHYAHHPCPRRPAHPGTGCRPRRPESATPATAVARPATPGRPTSTARTACSACASWSGARCPARSPTPRRSATRPAKAATSRSGSTTSTTGAERWPLAKNPERSVWSPAGGSSDCSSTADTNEDRGSTCNTTHATTGWTPGALWRWG